MVAPRSHDSRCGSYKYCLKMLKEGAFIIAP